jgi:hypothetical protein
VDVPDPLTLPLHDTAIVPTAVITFAGIVRWFRAELTGVCRCFRVR